MAGRHILVGVLVIALSGALFGTAIGAEQVIGSPEIAVFTPDATLQAGEDTTLGVFISNEGQLQRAGPGEFVDRVTTARGVTIEPLHRGGPIEVTTGRYPVGQLPVGMAGPINLSVSVADNASPGTYDIPVRVRYRYTRIVTYGDDNPSFVERTHDRIYDLSVTIERAPRFELRNSSAQARVGATGTASLTIENVGNAPARSAMVETTSPSSLVTFGQSAPAVSTFAGDWDPGETRSFEVPPRIDANAVSGTVPLISQVHYRDRDGQQHVSEPLTGGIVVRPRQEFQVSTSASSLAVGEPGKVRGTITNQGPEAVTAVSVRLDPATADITPNQRSIAIGRLGVGASKTVTFPFDVAASADAGTIPASVIVRYHDLDNNRNQRTDIDTHIDVAPERERLRTVPVATTVTIDTDDRIRVGLRNVGDDPLDDIRVQITPTAPFTSESPTAYVERLAPNESRTVAFGLSVDEDAVETTTALSLNITADRPDGKTILIEDEVVPVTVREEGGSSDIEILAVGVVVVIIALAGGWWWLRR